MKINYTIIQTNKGMHDILLQINNNQTLTNSTILNIETIVQNGEHVTVKVWYQ